MSSSSNIRYQLRCIIGEAVKRAMFVGLFVGCLGLFSVLLGLGLDRGTSAGGITLLACSFLSLVAAALVLCCLVIPEIREQRRRSSIQAQREEIGLRRDQEDEKARQDDKPLVLSYDVDHLPGSHSDEDRENNSPKTQNHTQS